MGKGNRKYSFQTRSFDMTLHFMLSHHKLTGFDEYDYKDEYFNILSLQSYSYQIILGYHMNTNYTTIIRTMILHFRFNNRIKYDHNHAVISQRDSTMGKPLWNTTSGVPQWLAHARSASVVFHNGGI